MSEIAVERALDASALACVVLGLLAIVAASAGYALGGTPGRTVAGVTVGLIAQPLAIWVGLSVPETHPEYAEWVRPNVRDLEAMLATKEFPADQCVQIEFAAPVGHFVEFTARNTCDEPAPRGVFLVDAIDGDGQVIGSATGDLESLAVPGSHYDSFVIFDTDVRLAATFEVRDLDSSARLYDAWAVEHLDQ